MKLLRLALLFGGFSLTLASAGPISFGVWYEFSFFDVGVPAVGCFPADAGAPECIPSSGTPTVFANAPPWTFFAGATGAVLTVTDAFFHGDAFQVFDFGGMIGVTVPVSAADFVSCGDDPVPCLADPLTSRGIFPLASGAHGVTITPYASPYGAGSAYFRVDSMAQPIPEPNLAVAVMLALFAVFWRRLSRAMRVSHRTRRSIQ